MAGCRRCFRQRPLRHIDFFIIIAFSFAIAFHISHWPLIIFFAISPFFAIWLRHYELFLHWLFFHCHFHSLRHHAIVIAHYYACRHIIIDILLTPSLMSCLLFACLCHYYITFIFFHFIILLRSHAITLASFRWYCHYLRHYIDAAFTLFIIYLPRWFSLILRCHYCHFLRHFFHYYCHCIVTFIAIYFHCHYSLLRYCAITLLISRSLMPPLMPFFDITQIAGSLPYWFAVISSLRRYSPAISLFHAIFPSFRFHFAIGFSDALIAAFASHWLHTPLIFHYAALFLIIFAISLIFLLFSPLLAFFSLILMTPRYLSPLRAFTLMRLPARYADTFIFRWYYAFFHCCHFIITFAFIEYWFT